jgi:hypothetical protein
MRRNPHGCGLSRIILGEHLSGVSLYSHLLIPRPVLYAHVFFVKNFVEAQQRFFDPLKLLPTLIRFYWTDSDFACTISCL